MASILNSNATTISSINLWAAATGAKARRFWRTPPPTTTTAGSAATHGWYSTMQEYDGRGGGKDGKAFMYEYGYSQGYQVNIQLRPGEKLTRNWSNQGLHINGPDGGAPGCMAQKAAADLLA